VWACLRDEWDQKRPGKWLKWIKVIQEKKVSLGGGEGNVRRYIGRTVVDTGGIVG